MRTISAAVLLTLLSACRSHTLRPVDIEPSDMCGYCRMAISQRQFAAEVLDADESAVKFDDIGCMLRYMARKGPKPAAIFVTNYTDRKWLDTRAAVFVRGSKVSTPMGGQILAFGKRAEAEAAVREWGGTVLTFEQLGAP